MKKKLFFTALFLAAGLQAQTCNELVQYAKSEESYPDRVIPVNSSMLAKAEYYQV